jgi:16S rRNA G966 N2-methylase RsmD
MPTISSSGDNLDVLRRYISSQNVDLVYLGPPFNSRQDAQTQGLPAGSRR